jgi:phosphate transport system permease protein
MQQGLVGVAPMPRPSVQARWRQVRERLVAGVVTLAAFAGIAALVLILVFVAKEALRLLVSEEARQEVSLGKLFLPQVVREGRPATFMWQPVSAVPKVSMIPLFIGTLKMTLVAMVVAVPLGVAAALYTSEFAPRRLREVLKPTIEMLAAIPSVVIGFFLLMVLASTLQEALGLPSRLNVLLTGLGLALAIVPVIYTVAEDALMAVPRSYREASLALGATAWETAWRVVLPAAAPGVLAACVLGFGRAIGETMIVLMASGNAALPTWQLTDSARSMSATIAAEMGEVVVGSTHYSLLFLIGVELFLFTFVLNLLAAAWTRAVLRRLGGTEAR